MQTIDNLCRLFAYVAEIRKNELQCYIGIWTYWWFIL